MEIVKIGEKPEATARHDTNEDLSKPGENRVVDLGRGEKGVDSTLES